MSLFSPFRGLALSRLVQPSLCHMQRRTAMKRSSRGRAFTGGRTPKFRGVRKQDGQCVKAGTIIVRQVGKVFWPGQNIRLCRDYSLQAESEGFVRFYWDRKHGPNQTSLSHAKIKRYCGIVFHPEDQLPRDESQEGRARRFPGMDVHKLRDYLRDGPVKASPAAQTVPFSDMVPPPDPFVRFSTDDAIEAAQNQRRIGPMSEREVDIANLMVKRKAVDKDGLPRFQNVRRALGMPERQIGANSLERAAKKQNRELNESRNKAQRRADRDLAFTVVSPSEMEAIRSAEGAASTAARRSLPGNRAGP